MFEGGVRFYTKGIAVVGVAFPENQVCCRWCQFCRAEESMKRHWCRLTNNVIYNIEALGANCPIQLEGKTEEDE